MKRWDLRTVEEANLLNPAFCCVALTSSVIEYATIDRLGMPYPLSFLVLPIVLHKATRERLTRSVATSFPVWIQENSQLRIGFYERVVALKPITRETIMFGLLHDWLVLETGGLVRATKSDSDANRFVRTLTDEAKECIRRARFVGKWFASAGSPQTVMALWGIRP